MFEVTSGRSLNVSLYREIIHSIYNTNRSLTNKKNSNILQKLSYTLRYQSINFVNHYFITYQNSHLL